MGSLEGSSGPSAKFALSGQACCRAKPGLTGQRASRDFSYGPILLFKAGTLKSLGFVSHSTLTAACGGIWITIPARQPRNPMAEIRWLSKDEKRLLKPHAEHFQAMASHIREATIEDLEALNSACRSCTMINCGWDNYAAAQY